MNLFTHHELFTPTDGVLEHLGNLQQNLMSFLLLPEQLVPKIPITRTLDYLLNSALLVDVSTSAWYCCAVRFLRPSSSWFMIGADSGLCCPLCFAPVSCHITVPANLPSSFRLSCLEWRRSTYVPLFSPDLCQYSDWIFSVSLLSFPPSSASRLPC